LAPWRRTERRTGPRRALAAGALLLGALAPAAGAAADAVAEADAPRTLAFARHGEPVATRDLASLRRALPASVVRVHEPYERGSARFEAFPLPALLDAVYGPGWRDEEELLFTCRDGYQPTVPVARVLRHHAWLAFRRTDQAAFTIRKRESGTLKRIDLGPFYLVWENEDDERIRQEADYGWPYQLVGIDLIRTRDRFPRLAPPPGASEQVHAGFEAFRIHCSKCHKLNGEGGRIGPELNAPDAPLADRDPAWLRSWIESPATIRPGTRMPPLNPELPDRDAVVADLIAYLRAMTDAGGR
jgi:mono/diheme cytochrome c family protein